MGNREYEMREARRLGEQARAEMASAEKDLQMAKKYSKSGLFTDKRSTDRKKYRAMENAQKKMQNAESTLNAYQSKMTQLGNECDLDYNTTLNNSRFNRKADIHHQNKGAAKVTHDSINDVLGSIQKMDREISEKNKKL